MEHYDVPLSVYCLKGTVNARRFCSLASRIQDHVAHALSELGVDQAAQETITQKLDGAHFSEGFRHDEPDYPSPERVVVYVTLFHEGLERCIAQTCGELQEFGEVFPETNGGLERKTETPVLPVADSEVVTDEGWRASA